MAYKVFGYDIDVMTGKVGDYLKSLQENELLRGEFVDL
jgi:hypothetical protein